MLLASLIYGFNLALQFLQMRQYGAFKILTYAWHFASAKKSLESPC